MIEKVVLGKTGLEVKRLGLGGIPIQRVDEQQAVETVLHAVEQGVDFIDTSRAYTTSERRIGLALRETDKRVVVATKSLEHTADRVRRDVDRSLKELGREKIELYQSHFIKDLDVYRRIIAKGGALEALLQARDEGLIDHIGITSHNLDLLDRIIDDGLFETIMVCYSFLENRAEQTVIPKALARNIGVIVMKPFSGGVIENPALALKYALALPGSVIIPGVESREKLDRNWEIFQGNLSLEAGELRQIEAIRAAFDKQFCRRCDYCQPCPEGISIQHILGVKSLVQRGGPGVLRGGWIREAVEDAKKCTACGTCLERCPYGLPIPDLIRSNLEWVEARLDETS